MTSALELATRLADDLETFELGRCGPSDDPDMQYAYTAAFRDIAKRFVAAVKRIGDPDLAELVAPLNLAPQDIVEAHDLRAELFVVIDALNQATQDPNYSVAAANNAAFLNPDVLLALKAVTVKALDPKKLVQLCTELNDSYARGNYLATALLLRAVLNHVPPAFGAKSFAEVVAQSGRSIKAILARLDEDARPLADLHTHLLMRTSEHLPTKNQLEPYKPGFEVLIQEVITRLSSSEA